MEVDAAAQEHRCVALQIGNAKAEDLLIEFGRIKVAVFVVLNYVCSLPFTGSLWSICGPFFVSVNLLGQYRADLNRWHPLRCRGEI